MTITGDFNNTSFYFAEDADIPDVLDKYCEDNILYNDPNLLFLEDEYINNTQFFTKILDKYKKKKFDGNLKIYIRNNIESLEDSSKEVNLYKKIIYDNNINGINKEDLNISVRLLNKYYSSEKTKKVVHIYILLLISNLTSFNQNTFTFSVKLDGKEVVDKFNFETSKELDLLDIYEWIMSSQENISTRLRIIREIILNKQSFCLLKTDLDSAKSAFNRIIKEETDKYFEQVNILKSDFLSLSDRMMGNYRSLHLKFLGWCSAIGIYIYDSLKDKKNDNLYYKLFFESNEKINIFLLLFALSLIVIWVIFVKEMHDYKKEYCKIKKIYTGKFFFEGKDFKEFFSKPKISPYYLGLFIFLLIVLAIRFLCPMLNLQLFIL